MIGTDDFYVTLPSFAKKGTEFEGNKPNQFSNRMPFPLRFAKGWKVGLSSISLPEAKSNIRALVGSDDNETLFKYTWIRDNRFKVVGGLHFSTGESHLNWGDFKKTGRHVFAERSGVEFMKSMISFYDQKKYTVDAPGGPLGGTWYINHHDMRRSYVKFKWEGEDLLTDNKDTTKVKYQRKLPSFSISTSLAAKMGWLREKDEGYALGPNLLFEFYDHFIPDISRDKADLLNSDGSATFWKIEEGFLRLSVYCNWRFVNLNAAFKNVVGFQSETGSIFIYSTLGASTIVGNKVADLLRQVPYDSPGNRYFETSVVQYIPLRNEVIDIIETELTDSRGELFNLPEEGETILTIHFKREE